MLKRLRIQGFKSLADIEVEFPARTVLSRPNASGKSNLLDVLLILSRMATERTLADALTHELRQPEFQGSVSGKSGGVSIHAHYLVQYKTPTGRLQGRLFNFVYNPLAKEVRTLTRFEVGSGTETCGAKEGPDISNARERIETALQNAIIEWLPDRQSRAGLQISLIGLHSNS